MLVRNNTFGMSSDLAPASERIAARIAELEDRVRLLTAMQEETRTVSEANRQLVEDGVRRAQGEVDIATELRLRETADARSKREALVAEQQLPIIEAIRELAAITPKTSAELPRSVELLPKTPVSRKKKTPRPEGLLSRQQILAMTPTEAREYAQKLGVDIGKARTSDGVDKKLVKSYRGPPPEYAALSDTFEQLEGPGGEPTEEKPPLPEEGSGLRQKGKTAAARESILKIFGEVEAGNRPVSSELLRLARKNAAILKRAGELSALEAAEMLADLGRFV